jgi:hypothetical protein
MFDVREIHEQLLYSAVKAADGDEAASQIVDGEDGNATAEDNAAWVKSTMNRLESRFDAPVVKQIRMACQCGYAMDEKLALLRELMASASGMEEFVAQDKAKAAGLYCDGGVLFLRFHFCPCPMLAEVERLDSCAWCQCTTGYSAVLFEKAFGCPVDVELLKSIKAGDACCLMKIVPRGTVAWGRCSTKKI